MKLYHQQTFPGHKRPAEESQRVTVAWGQERGKRWMSVLDQRLLGPDKPCLCGAQLTIADY
jgi:glutathione S-transferase